MSESSSNAAVLTPAERRQRRRQEMTDAILAAARAIMQEDGVAALNLNEVARRVRLRPQSLSEYFPNKAALYDALFVQALATIREGDETAYRDHPPGWAQIEAWIANRMAFAVANTDSYHLVFDAPVPAYIPDGRVIELTRGVLAGARRMVAEAVAANVIAPGMPVNQATDVLLALRRGLIAERIGKQRVLGDDSVRFDTLLPVVMHMLKVAWAPQADPAPSGIAAATSEGDADG